MSRCEQAFHVFWLRQHLISGLKYRLRILENNVGKGGGVFSSELDCAVMELNVQVSSGKGYIKLSISNLMGY